MGKAEEALQSHILNERYAIEYKIGKSELLKFCTLCMALCKVMIPITIFCAIVINYYIFISTGLLFVMAIIMDAIGIKSVSVIKCTYGNGNFSVIRMFASGKEAILECVPLRDIEYVEIRNGENMGHNSYFDSNYECSNCGLSVIIVKTTHKEFYCLCDKYMYSLLNYRRINGIS